MGKQWKQWEIIWGGTKITADSDCIHEIKKRLLLGRKAMTNLDSILKSRDITLPTKVCVVKAMVLPIVMYGCESWTIKKSEHQRIGAFELWCWRRLLGVPWIVRPFQVTQTIKNLPAIQDTCIWSLVRKIPWRREWQPNPVFLPWEFHEQRSLVGYSPLGHKELDKLSN